LNRLEINQRGHREEIPGGKDEPDLILLISL
jgi:hypothetical protein